ncbi:hypothetical protein AAFF_G00298350 [Aldrovandia affinis]|uniref:Uncharacterized protein n=1 Tax=Aldrovandia affinis TaxID=143900 RepID=A0AAD7R980_9TELE|nr:hypothetical protein AAFF_G00298350 [Aldrovandia affinis]
MVVPIVIHPEQSEARISVLSPLPRILSKLSPWVLTLPNLSPSTLGTLPSPGTPRNDRISPDHSIAEGPASTGITLSALVTKDHNH